jgi:hypothetical protein
MSPAPSAPYGQMRAPIVQALLSNPQKEERKNLGERAKIAQLLIESAFEYFRANSRYLTPRQQQEIDDAIELSKHFTVLLLLILKEEIPIGQEVEECEAKNPETILRRSRLISGYGERLFHNKRQAWQS